MNELVYLDHNATTPMHPAAAAAVRPYLEGVFGNPASLHAAGRAAHEAVEVARAQTAALLGGVPAETVTFTGSGTEALLTAITGFFEARRHFGRHVVATAMEHSCVLDACDRLAKRRDAEVSLAPAEPDGTVDPDRFAAAVTAETVVACVMAANNETGVILDVRAAVAAAVRKNPRVRVVVDAVQYAGKLPVPGDLWGAHAAAVAAHKFGGPKGVGALTVDVRNKIVSLIPGTQEFGRRGGTVNVPGIVGAGVAAERAHAAAGARDGTIAALRDRLEAGVRAAVPDVIVNGGGAPRLPNTSNLTFAGAEGEALLVQLDQHGICASSGSACKAGSTEPSHVLVAMGRSRAEARNSVRFSLGAGNTAADIERVLRVLPPIVQHVRAFTTHNPRRP